MKALLLTLLPFVCAGCFAGAQRTTTRSFVEAPPRAAGSDVLIHKFKTTDSRVQSVAFSPDGKMLAAGYGFYDDGGITIWRVADRSRVAALLDQNWENAGIECVVFSDDGKSLGAATDKGDVMIWNVGSWQSPRTLLTNGGDTTDLAFSPDSSKLAYSSDRKAVIIDPKTGEATTIATRADIGRGFEGVSFSPDGKSVIVCGNNLIQIWDINRKKIVKSWPTNGFGFFGRTSPNGNHVIEGGGAIFGEKIVNIWNLNGEKLAELNEFRNGLFALAISHSGKLFAVAGGNYGGGEGSISLWNVPEAQELGFTSFGDYPIKGLAFSPDDKMLAAASEDGYALLYSVDKLRGSELRKQDASLCGELQQENDKFFVVPLSKVPRPMRPVFEFPWKLEVANPETAASLIGSPVVLTNWSIQSSAARDRARISEVQSLLPGGLARQTSDYVVFGYVQNPGWNEGYVIKIYDNDRFVATDNNGKCRAYGSLAQLKTDFRSVKKRLLDEGLLSIGREPLTLGADHYGTNFIELTVNGASELRTDADDIEALLKGGPARKREAFSNFFQKERSFVTSLLKAGMTLPGN